MAKGKVKLAGRFPAGTTVKLVAADDAGVLRSEGGEELATHQVKDDGTVEFPLEAGARGFIVGYVDGSLVEARVVGREDADAAVIAQPAVGPDRVRLADGSWADEEPKRIPKGELPMEAAPSLSQRMVPDGTEQRSDTPRGTAHPLDPDEPAPYEAQENIKDSVPQMSDTETGAAARILLGAQRQEDVPSGVWQRSDTPTGVAAVIPGQGAVKAQQARESSFGKETRGEPVRVAAEPLAVASGAGGGEVRNQPALMTQPGTMANPDGNDRLNRTGLDAQGQPVYPDVARASGLVPAKRPGEAFRNDPPDAKVTKKDETVATSGAEAKREAVPDPTGRRRAKPPEGDMAADQTADPSAKVEPVKAPGRPKS